MKKERWIFADSDEESEHGNSDEEELWTDSELQMDRQKDSGNEDEIRPASVLDDVNKCVWISEV